MVWETTSADDREGTFVAQKELWIELQAAEAEACEHQGDRKRQERQRPWELIRDQAVIKAGERHRAQVHTSQVDHWREARGLGGNPRRGWDPNGAASKR